MTARRTFRILSIQPVADGGGSEVALIRLFRCLAGRGWECHVAVPEQARLADEYAASGAAVHVVGMARLTTSGGPVRWVRYAAGWPPTVARLARLARDLDVDVVHSNSLHSWHGWAAAALSSRPHVWHAREIVFQSPYALRVERWLARRFADRVVAVSDAVAAQLDPANVVVVTDEADPDRFGPERAGRFRAGAGIADDVALVGSVARLDTWKGFEVLLDAVADMQAARPGLEVAVAGGAVEGKEDYAAALRRRAGAMAGVHWLGRRADVEDLMADLDVFVQVSTEPEPYGLVLVEALASGVPVVAGAAGGPLEILRGLPEQAGRLVPPGDAAALASAVVSLLPEGPSSAERRRARGVLRRPSPDGAAEIFEAAARRRRRGG